MLVGTAAIMFLDFRIALLIIGALFLMLIPIASFGETANVHVKLAEYRKDFSDRKVLAIGVIMLLFGLHWGAESTSYGLFLKNNLGLDIFSIGLYSSMSLLFLGSTAYFFGRRIDSGKMNMKYVFFAGMLISGAFHILHTVPIPWLSFVFRAAHEVGDGMAAIAMYFWISRLFSNERIGGNSSTMFTMSLMGQVAGSLIFGHMGHSLGYHVPLIVSGVTSIVCAFLLLTFVRIFKISER